MYLVFFQTVEAAFLPDADVVNRDAVVSVVVDGGLRLIATGATDLK